MNEEIEKIVINYEGQSWAIPDTMPGKTYNELSAKIADVCAKYGYTQCHLCPLVSACSAERDIENGESQTEFTERWEQAMAEEFARQFPNLV